MNGALSIITVLCALANVALLLILFSLVKGFQSLATEVRNELRAGREDSRITARELREELSGTIRAMDQTVHRKLADSFDLQQRHLESMTRQVTEQLSTVQKTGLAELSNQMDSRIRELREGSDGKLEELRQAVSTNLQQCVETQARALDEASERQNRQLERITKAFSAASDERGPMTLREFMASSPDYRLSMSEIGDNSSRILVERYSEQRCAFVPMPDDRVLCKVLGKYLMWVDARDNGLSPHLIFQGYWEVWITAAVARFARRGTTVVDVGANVGYYTILLADAVGPEGRVVAFEPNPRIAEMLRMSVSINGYASTVSVRTEAVSAKRGPGLTFAIPRHEPKNAGLVRTKAERASYLAQFGKDVSFIRVPAITLDSLALRNVGIVKVDAEGAEESVWEGMQETIDNNPEICIVLELNCSRGYDAVALYHRMSKRFSVRHIDFDGEVKPLTLDMLASQRLGSDWMLFLCRN